MQAFLPHSTDGMENESFLKPVYVTWHVNGGGKVVINSHKDYFYICNDLVQWINCPPK